MAASTLLHFPCQFFVTFQPKAGQSKAPRFSPAPSQVSDRLGLKPFCNMFRFSIFVFSLRVGRGKKPMLLRDLDSLQLHHRVSAAEQTEKST